MITNERTLRKLFEHLKHKFASSGHPLYPTCEYCDDQLVHDAVDIILENLRSKG